MIVMSIESKKVGFIVDDASEVITISSENVEPAPEIVAGIDRRYITGIGKVEEKSLLYWIWTSYSAKKNKKL